jgi:hypothetical protein
VPPETKSWHVLVLSLLVYDYLYYAISAQNGECELIGHNNIDTDCHTIESTHTTTTQLINNTLQTTQNHIALTFSIHFKGFHPLNIRHKEPMQVAYSTCIKAHDNAVCALPSKTHNIQSLTSEPAVLLQGVQKRLNRTFDKLY